jgi:hypothetical protein
MQHILPTIKCSLGLILRRKKKGPVKSSKKRKGKKKRRQRKKRRRQRKKKRRPSRPVQICLAEDLRVSTPPSMNLSCDVHGDPMISRLGGEELQLGIGEKECHILVSGHTGTETFIFKYPNGKIR